MAGGGYAAPTEGHLHVPAQHLGLRQHEGHHAQRLGDTAGGGLSRGNSFFYLTKMGEIKGTTYTNKTFYFC